MKIIKSKHNQFLGFGIGLIISVQIHWVFFQYFINVEFPTANLQEAKRQPFNIKLESQKINRDSMGSDSPKGPVKKAGKIEKAEVIEKKSEKQAPPAALKPQGTLTPKRNATLNLSLPEKTDQFQPTNKMYSVIANNNAAKWPKEGITTKTLSNTPRVMKDGDFTSNSGVGNGWSRYVRVNDNCYDVVAADPLDSLSVEQWYPVSCR